MFDEKVTRGPTTLQDGADSNKTAKRGGDRPPNAKTVILIQITSMQ